MATGKITKLPEPETIPNAVELTSFQNNWQGNGLSFYQVLGNLVHLHCSIRNGTQTSGVVILEMPALSPTAASLAPVFHLTDKAITGYAMANTNGKITLNNLTSNTSVVFDLYWTTA